MIIARLYREKHSFRYIGLAFCIFCYTSVFFAQNFVKKDTSELIPFISKFYYYPALDTFSKHPDRLLYNHRINPFGQNQNFSGLTGTLGSTLVPVLVENTFYQNIKLGRSINDPYFYNDQSIPYFALNKPLSELDFTFFGNGNEEFRGFLSQNITKKLNLGIGIRRTNNKGYFLQQENTHSNLYVHIVHDAERIRTNLEFVFNEMNLKESGGYKPDIFQSGLVPGQWLAANPSLAVAKNQLKNYQLNFRYRYLVLGAKPSADSLLFIPKKSSLYIDHHFQRFSDRQFYSDTFNALSRQEYGILSRATGNQFNSLYLQSGLLTNFRITYAWQGLSVSGYTIFSDNSIEIGQHFGQYVRSYEYLNLGLGGDVSYQWKKDIKIIGKGYKSFLGYTENDFYLRGELQGNCKLADWRAWADYGHQKPSLISNIVYGTSIDTFYALNTQKTLETGLSFNLDKHKFSGRVQYFMTEDFLTYDSLQRPIQLGNNYFQIYFKKEWSFKSFYFPTEVFFQNSLFQRGMLRQMLAFKNKLFNEKNNVLLGAELSLNLGYLGAHYSSFFMQPIFSAVMPQAEIYPKVDLFATFKISKVHLSLVFENFLSTYLKTGMSYLNYHPIAPSAFYLRMNWRFLE